MAGKAKKKDEQTEPKPESKPKKSGKYEVLFPLWIRGIKRFPGYVLTDQDVASKAHGDIEHMIETKLIKEV